VGLDVKGLLPSSGVSRVSCIARIRSWSRGTIGSLILEPPLLGIHATNIKELPLLDSSILLRTTSPFVVR
jgi:hypothetical protein